MRASDHPPRVPSRNRRRLPPPNWLRAFEAAARHLSFTAAAKELHVTQSAVSQQVRLLEQYLHEPLFHRHPRRLQLTHTGEIYLASVHEAFEELARSTAELFGHRKAERIVLRVNAAFAIYWLTPRLARFQARHPDIDIRVNISLWLTEPEWEAVSLEIRYGRGNWSGVRKEQLTEETLAPVCAPALLERTPGLASVGDLRHQNLLHVIGNNDGWAHWLDAPGQDDEAADIDVESGVQFDTSALALEYAAAGGGVAIGASSLTRTMLASGQLVRPFGLTVPSNESFYLVSPEARTDSAQTQALRAWLLEESTAERQTGDASPPL